MSLYYDTLPFLSSDDAQGSLKSRIFRDHQSGLKSQPKQIYALASEAAKWSPILAEVIEKAELLESERKLTPELSLLLVHDLLLNKKGICAPSSHPFRLTVEKHKSRLKAELNKVRVKHGCASVEGLYDVARKALCDSVDGPSEVSESLKQPRWIRVNTLKTSLDQQLRTTFATYKRVDGLEKLETFGSKEVLCIDEHIPNLLALPSSTDLTRSPAYLEGNIVLQDKASCFPAYMLNPTSQDEQVIDACAAPGNKTTHLAAILHETCYWDGLPTIHACERDKTRSQTLSTMVETAGAAPGLVMVHAGQDFLKIDPNNKIWRNASALLLDPSCSGSGMVGRDEALQITLPQRRIQSGRHPKQRNKKRKKPYIEREEPVSSIAQDPSKKVSSLPLKQRLHSLAAFQLSLLLHAFSFPNARRITYSTCSIYQEENERVVMDALGSDIARRRRWQILLQGEQVEGLRKWPLRGKVDACGEGIQVSELDLHQIARSCIRCEKGTKDRTQGFFVAAFIRHVETATTSTKATEDDDEFNGFPDD